MKTLNGLPVYKMTIDEDDNFTGVEFISLVDQPAIEVNWVAFKETIKRYSFDADKQIVTGPAMIPDLPIYRFDKSIGEYYVSFDQSEIEKIARKFNKEQRTLGINYQHQDDSQVKSATIIEQWFISDKKNDKSNAFGFDLPVGTWMVSVHISDSKFWNNEVKSGNVKGYSIEGFLNLEMSKIKMNKHKQKFEKVETAALNSPIWLNGPLAVDTYVFNAEPQVILLDGTEQRVIQYPIWESIIELADGQVLTIYNGKIVEINKKQDSTTMNKIKMNVEVKTKDGVVIWSPADSIAEGVEVYNVSETGEQTAVADGDYTLEDGSVITVASGKVTVIVASETSSSETDKPANEDKKAKYEITTEDIQAISEALGIADLVKRIEVLETSNTAMAKENKELKDKFSKIPGLSSTTTTKDDETNVKTKMSIEDKASALRLLKNKK